jgi:hypothetical protein
MAASNPYPAAPDWEASDVPLTETLTALATEIGELARLSDRLQFLISAALVADGAANADHLREFQAIDLLVQRLHGVTNFVESLSALMPAGWRIDAAAAASRVSLTDLARRLSGQSPAPLDSSSSDDDDGDFELFA